MLSCRSTIAAPIEPNADHERDNLDLLRLPQQLERPLERDACLLLVGGSGAIWTAAFSLSEDRRDERHAGDQGESAPQQQRVGADGLDDEGGQARAGHAAEHDAAADEPEQPLGLPGIVDAVGEGPELADDKDARADCPRRRSRPRPSRPTQAWSGTTSRR